MLASMPHSCRQSCPRLRTVVARGACYVLVGCFTIPLGAAVASVFPHAHNQSTSQGRKKDNSMQMRINHLDDLIALEGFSCIRLTFNARRDFGMGLPYVRWHLDRFSMFGSEFTNCFSKKSNVCRIPFVRVLRVFVHVCPCWCL
jgi:hypothetical protein